MINAYRYNYEHLPAQLQMGSFDQEREIIYTEMMRLIKQYELSSSKNWFPINNLISKFKSIYSFTIEERQDLSKLLLTKVGSIQSIVGMQNIFSLLCTIIQNKQKYFTNFEVDWKYWNTYLEDRFMTNKDKTITSQTFTTQLFNQFCQFLKTIKYFFTADVVDFAFQKFKEALGYQDKQLAWAYLMLFIPFRTDIPQAKFDLITSYLMDQSLILGADKDNCRFKFILNFLRIYPKAKVDNLMPQMMRFFHGFWRVDLHQDEKNEKLVNLLLPDDTLGVPSLFKIMPQLLVELIGSSAREGYQEYMHLFRSLFQLIDSITSVHNQSTWDDQIFKLIKLIVGNFVMKFRKDSLLRLINEYQENSKYDKEVAKDLMEDIIKKFNNDSKIQDFIENDKYLLELLVVNPDQGHCSFLSNYPTKVGQVNTNHVNGKTKANINSLLPELLDEQAKSDFLGIVMSVIDKILFMEDPGYSTAKSVLYLCSFEPKLIDYFLTKMKQAMNNVTVLPFVTIKSILIFLTIPILQGRNQFTIHQLKDFMELTYNLFEIQGMTENIDSLELYCKIFMNVPILTQEEYSTLYGEDSEICTFLSDFIQEVFRLIIKNFNLIKYKDVDYGFVLPNLINIFWPYICNASNKILDNIIQQLLAHIENEIDHNDLNAMGDLLDCITFKCPEKILEHIINLVTDKLIKPGKQAPHFLDFLIPLSKYATHIQGCEATAGNKNSKLLWLTLLEKSLTYSSSYSQKFDKQLQTIIMIYLQDEEDDVFVKVSDIIHTTIITNQMIKPANMSWQNKPKDFFKSDFDQKHYTNLSELQVDWVLPTKQDWEFIFTWNYLFMIAVKEEFQTKMKGQGQFLIPQDFKKLLDLMIFQTPVLDPKLKQQCYRMWFLIFGSFTGSSLFIPFHKPDLDPEESKGHQRLHALQVEYLNKVCPPEYFNLRKDLGDFVIQSVCYALSKGIAHDKDINDLLITIGSECVGCQIISQELMLGRDFLEGNRQLNQTSGGKLYFESRIQVIIDINTYLYQRHMFLMSLQAIPKEYNDIYCYIIVLYLLTHSDFTNPQYLLPYSMETTYTLSTGIRQRFFQYLLEILDYQNPESRLCQIHQSSDKSKGYKQLQDLLTGFNTAVQNISPDIAISITLQQQLNQFITILNYVDNQQCKNLLTESCVHNLTIQYDENNAIGENDLEARKAMIDISCNSLQQSTLFWKCKIVHSLSLFNNINICQYVPINCVSALKELCICDHPTLNQLGRSGLFYLLRLAKQEMYTKEQIQPESNDKLPFQQFIQYRFVTKTQLAKVEQSYKQLRNIEDVSKYDQPIYRLKNHEKYIMAPNCMIKTTITQSKQPFVQQLMDLFTDIEYMKLFMAKILIDKDVQPSSEFDITENETQAQEIQFMSVAGITKYVQIFFSYIYCKNKTRHSPFSATQSFFMSDFYFRLFKKIFQVCGIKAFRTTKATIDEYLTEADNREKQRLVSCYLTALHRSLLNVGDYINDSMKVVLPNVTQEIFYDYHLAFYYLSRDQDWQWLSPNYLSFIECCKEMTNTTGLKSLRYIQLLKILIQSQGPRTIILQDECFKEIQQIIPMNGVDMWPSSNHVEEYIGTLATMLLQAILVPVPLDAGYNETHLFKTSANYAIWYNENVQEFFVKLNNFLRTPKPENLKNYQELAARLLEYIMVTKYDKYAWQFILESLKLIFENNNTEIDSQEILRKYIESEYEDSSELVKIAEAMTLHDNWIIRKRANLFLRDWYFRIKLEGQVINGIPESLMNNFEDKNAQIQMQALTSVADYLRLYNEQELQVVYKEVKQNRVYIVMAMLLSRMDRNYEWTNTALQEVFQLKNRKLLQEFVSEYWKSRQDVLNVFEQHISEENIQQLKEIVNPYVYFA